MNRNCRLSKESLSFQETPGFRKRTVSRRLGLMAGLALLIWLLPPTAADKGPGVGGERVEHHAEQSIPAEIKDLLMRDDHTG